LIRSKDQLSIKKTWFSYVLPLLVLFNRVQRVWNNRSPAARKRTVERAIEEFKRSLALNTTPTTYQRNTSNPSQQQLPETVEN